MQPKNITISFDIFDTLITRRTITPTGIFTIMQEQLGKNVQYDDFPEFFKNNFYTLRVQGEAYLRRTLVSEDVQDITFEEIYEVLGHNNYLSNAQIKRLKELEITTEEQNILGISENIKKLKQCIKENYNVVLISDMYLPTDIVRRLLVSVDEVFKNIPLFISSEYRKTKQTGDLYEIVRKKLGLNKNAWKHVGDNPKGDIEAAKKYGIQTEKYNVPIIKDYEKRNLEINNTAYVQLSIGTSRYIRMEKKENAQYELGACYGGPLFYDYVNWIIEQAIKRKIKRLYFIARDGYILKIMSDIIIKEHNYDIQTKYIYGSRDAWRLASILSNKEDITQTLLNSVEINNVEDFADVIHIDEKVLKNNIHDLKISNIIDAENIIKKNDKLRKLIVEKAKQERHLVVKYLRQELDLTDDNFCFVEFKGTGKTQDCLNKIIGTFYNKDISSFYMMLDKNQFLQTSNKIVYMPNRDYSHHIVEIFLRALHGQTIGYYNKNGIIEPLLEESETTAYIKWGYDHYIKGIEDYTRSFVQVSKYLKNLSSTVMYKTYFNYLMKNPDYEFANLVGAIPYTNGTKIKEIREAAPILRECDVNNIDNPTRQTSRYEGRLFNLSLVRSRDQKTKRIFYKDIEPDISVILPVYNVERYLEQCLTSLTQQTLKNIEIICVDDGSTDKSLELLKKLAERDKRIHIIEQTNRGAGVARNTGLKNARGKYLSFLDADDFFELNMLEVLFTKARNDDLDIAICDINLYDNETKLFSKPSWILKQNEIPNKNVFNYKDVANSIFSFSHTAAWNKLFKHSFVEKEHLEFQDLSNSNDFYFVCAALVSANKIGVCNQRLLNYRTNNKASLSNVFARKLNPENGYTAIKKLSEKLRQMNIYEEVEQSLIDRLLSIYYYNANLGDKYLKNYIYKRFKNQWVDEFKLNDRGEKYFKRHVYYEMLQEIKNTNIVDDNKEQPKISILVPIYNVKKYLAECIDSIIAQTLTNIEIILLDDGSTDGSSQICDEYAAKDHRIKVIHKPNSGYGATMNKGLDVARGKYIGIVESDDYIRPEMYEEQYKLAEEKQLDFLKADFRIFVGDGKYRTFTYRPMSYNKQYYNRILKPQENTDIFNTYNTIWSGIYNRDFINKNNIRFNETPGASYQDNGFYFQTYSLANRMWIMDKDFYQLRRDNPNSSVKSKAKVFCMCDEYLFIEKFLEKNKYLKDKLYKIFLFKKCQNYMFTLDRIAFEFKLMFLERMSEEFRNVYKQGYISEPEFPEAYIIKIKKIIKNYKKYYTEYLEQVLARYKGDIIQWYQKTTGKYLDLDNPRNFNEKIQWLKLYDSTPIKTRLTDKYLVRDWVKEKIGEKYLISLLGVYDSFEEIDFNNLPNKFVIKCNHGSGWDIIVKDKSKLDLTEVKARLDKWMNENFALNGASELHYRDIKPKIIIEKFIQDKATDDLYDYKFWCFNGKVKYIQLLSKQNLSEIQMAFYDKNWLKQDFAYSYPLSTKKVEKPRCLDKMIQLAEILSKGFPYVRVDFYLLNDDSIYFEKMNFTPDLGVCKWNEEQINIELGNMIRLPKMAYNIDTAQYYKLPNKSKLKPYLFFPYYLSKKLYLTNQKKNLIRKEIQQLLKSARIDVKNFGNENNAVAIKAITKVYRPTWFANASGRGQVIEFNKKIQNISISVIQEGKLRLDFKSADKRFEGERFPVWIDYESIKIDGKEILSMPVATWHDKPFRYEMPVKDGQVVKVEVIQQYHQYSKDELKDVILKLNPNSEYIKDNIAELVRKIYQKINKKTYKKRCMQNLINKFSFAHKIAPIMDLIQKNQVQTLKQLQGIQDKNINLENKNNELKREIEVLKGTFNTQLSDFKKQQEERSKQLIATGDKLSAELQRAMEELQNSGLSEISEIKTYCTNFAEQLDSTQAKMIRELKNQRETALQNKNNIIDGINQTEQSLQIQITKSQELVQKQRTVLDSVRERLEDLSVLKEIDFAQQSELNVLSQDIEKQKSQLLEKVQNLQNKAQLQYQELNFADLLHDSTQNSPWLKDKNFALYGWAANYSFIYTLFRILDNVQPAHILEMGLGQTSMVTSQYIANNKHEADLDIIENDENWIKIYEPKLAKSSNIKLHQCDIEFFDYEGEQSRKYKDINRITKDKKYNLILVDGPFGGAQKFPRSNIIELVEHNLAKDFIIIFDDAERPGEQNTIAQTKVKLTSLGIGFSIQQRNAQKSQVLIFSKSCEFAKYL